MQVMVLVLIRFFHQFSLKSFSSRQNFTLHDALIRRSHQRCSEKKGVLRNFVKFTGNHLCQSLFLIKLQAWGCEFCENFKNTFFIEHLWTLLLTFVKGSKWRSQTKPAFLQIWNETVKVCQKVSKCCLLEKRRYRFFVSQCELMFRQSLSDEKTYSTSDTCRKWIFVTLKWL